MDPKENLENLSEGDFSPGSFGHKLINELAPSDLIVEKIAYSAFYMSRMDWLLKQAGIKNLIFVIFTQKQTGIL